MRNFIEKNNKHLSFTIIVYQNVFIEKNSGQVEKIPSSLETTGQSVILSLYGILKVFA
jgi:hypothetical protein